MKPRQSDRRTAARWLACLVPALLVGCSGTLLPKPAAPPARFTLDSAGVGAAGRAALLSPAPPAGAPVLVVALPQASPGHDSRRMVYLRQPQELEAFAFHEWVDTPAHMLAPLLVQSLQSSAAFGAVLLAPSAASGALRLETQLIRLQQDFSSRPSHVRLTLRAVLLDSTTRQVIGWREFDEIVQAPSDDPVGGVAAAGLATRRVLAALTAFCTAQARP